MNDNTFSKVLSDVFTVDNMEYLARGLGGTLAISIITVFASIFLGTIFAICRNYSGKVPRSISSVYIEIFRNTPLLLWILICIFMLPFGTPFWRGTLALILYTSSVIAEIMRGGLNSIPKGQFEAARSQGFNFVQSLVFIILPQCFRRVVPSLMSQIITTIKDTSFLATFAIAEFFYNAKNLMGTLPQRVTVTSAHIFVIYIFIALVYFIINFMLSCIVRRLGRKTTH
ncbi:MAG: amino acid ABC transporter permease [Spirochaetaceae bacterium]|jgi:putative glutamine transport system permease protein|nr:amino acid ABC transporter permease [Spirochaetaceae bacterium]